MKNQLEPVLINEDYLKDKIYIVRGQKVMLDSDLARIYGYTTSQFNRQVQRNIEKFDEDFMFQLTIFEYNNLMCQNGTSSWGGVRKLPFVFTEQGIYMLMTVLKGDLAIKQSKALIRLFKKMKDYIIENRELLPSKELELRTSLLEKDVKDINNHLNIVDNSLNKVMGYFEDSNNYKHFLILDGMKLEADIAYKKIFKLARKSIIYIDDYIGIKTLELLSYAKKGIDITIFSDNKARPTLKQSIIEDYKVQNSINQLTLLKSLNKFHDRYIVIDFKTKNESIYHCGASLKDSGNKITTITKLENPILYRKSIEYLFNNQNKKNS